MQPYTHTHTHTHTHRAYWKKSALLLENIPYVKLPHYNQTHLHVVHPKFKLINLWNLKFLFNHHTSKTNKDISSVEIQLTFSSFYERERKLRFDRWYSFFVCFIRIAILQPNTDINRTVNQFANNISSCCFVSQLSASRGQVRRLIQQAWQPLSDKRTGL